MFVFFASTSRFAASTSPTTHLVGSCIAQNWLHLSSSHMCVPLVTVRHRAEQRIDSDGLRCPGVFVTITVGFSANRTVTVVASPSDAFSDIASTMKMVLELAEQHADIRFVDANSTCLRMATLLSEHREASTSAEPMLLTAVFQPSWQVKVLTNGPHRRMCDCRRDHCPLDVWGYSITINTNCDPAVYKRGAITRLRCITKRMKSKQWDRFYHWHPPGYNVRKLCKQTAFEYLWACQNCDKIAIVALASCTPTDPHNSWPWQVSAPSPRSTDDLKEEVWCGQCYENWHVADRIAHMSWIDLYNRRTAELAHIDTRMI